MVPPHLEFFKSKRILVTGGAGFIGSHLVEALLRLTDQVVVVDLVQKEEAINLNDVLNQVHYIQGSVCDSHLLERALDAYPPDVIFHLAANASVPRSVKEPLFDFEQNATGTLVLLEMSRRVVPEAHLVIISSGAVYGEPGEHPISETDPIKPISPYGLSKSVAEFQTRFYCEHHGTRASIARLFNCYGPRVPRFVMLDLLNKLREDPNHLEILGTGRQTRDFTYVSDTVDGILAVGSKGKPGEAYNIASGRSTSVRDLAQMLMAIRGLTPRISFSGSSWSGDAQFWSVAIHKARSLGYSPAISLEEGLRLMVAWYDEVV